jgi:Fe-S cluster assembly ATP-binding protein
LAGGRIAREGGKELALELEEKGYDWITKAPAPNTAGPANLHAAK